MLDKSEKSKPIQNISAQEVARFDQMAEQWWDPNGKYKTALAFNQARLIFIQQQIESYFASRQSSKQLTVLDVGCGGGLISEPLAQRGYQVTGIDPSAVSIEVARRHALKSEVEVQYLHAMSDDLDPNERQYDVVINAEVVEHVPDQQQLIAQCCKLVKPGGLLILATLNRTFRAYLIAILGAEYLLRYLPIGTHSWSKFVKPQELLDWSKAHGFAPLARTGMQLNPLTGNWSLQRSLAVNYVLSLHRP